MKSKLIYFLTALAMILVASCSKDGEEITPTPPEKEQTYTITFAANGGEGEMAEQVVEEGVEVALTANTFTRTDYTFASWNTSTIGTNTSYADGAKVTLSEDITLYAQWTENIVEPTGLFLANISADNIPEGDVWTIEDTDETASKDKNFKGLIAALKALDASRSIDIIFPNLVTIPEYALSNCDPTAKWTFSAPEVTKASKMSFGNSENLTKLDLPKTTYIGFSVCRCESLVSLTLATVGRLVEVEYNAMLNMPIKNIDLITHESNVDGLRLKLIGENRSYEFNSVNGKYFSFDPDAVILVNDKLPESDILFMRVNTGETLSLGDINTGKQLLYFRTEWSSSDPTVVSVSESEGESVYIQALKDGTAVITASDKEGNTITINIAIGLFSFAQGAQILVDGVSGDYDSYTTKRFETSTLYVGKSWNMESYDYFKTKWSTSDSSVVIISESKGAEIEITPLKEGVATITATDEKGNERTLKITVEDFVFAADARIIVDETSEVYDNYTLELYEYRHIFIGKSSNMAKYNYTKTKWSSTNPSVLKVADSAYDTEAVMTALSPGTATIIAEDEKGNRLMLNITVPELEFANDARILISGIRGEHESYIFKREEQATLYIGNPSDMEDYDYSYTKWSSSDSMVAKVSKATGSKVYLTTPNPGCATITAEDEVGNELTLVVYVNAPALVGDYYYDNNTWSTIEDENRTVIGFIINVNSDLYSGTVVGCRETDTVNRYTSESTGSFYSSYAATDDDSGMKNMREVINANILDDLPVFEAVHELNPRGTNYNEGAKGIWYLPAVNQLKVVLQNADRVRDYRLNIPKQPNGAAFAGSTMMHTNDHGNFSYAKRFTYSTSKGWEQSIHLLYEEYRHVAIMDF